MIREMTCVADEQPPAGDDAGLCWDDWESDTEPAGERHAEPAVAVIEEESPFDYGVVVGGGS